MKPPIVISLVALSICLVACGGGDKARTPVAATASAHTASTGPKEEALNYAKADRDRDNDGTLREEEHNASAWDEPNNSVKLPFGHPARAADRQAIARLIRRYYAAALAADGGAACSMLYITLAESVVEDYGHGSAGPPYLRQGRTCPAVMELLFKHYRPQIAMKQPLLEVSRVQLARRNGLVILSFGKTPEREISVRAQGSAWKLDSLIDGELP
jgi:hypothetical protein